MYTRQSQFVNKYVPQRRQKIGIFHIHIGVKLNFQKDINNLFNIFIIATLIVRQTGDKNNRHC